MDLLGALGILARVVETGSFSAVARERSMSQAAIARQIAQLEEHYAVRLLHRTTRKLSLTNDGEILLGHAGPILDGVEGLEAALRQQSSSPVGLVRVGLPVAAGHCLSTRLPALLAAHPGLKVELVVSDRLGDLVEGRLDLAMRRGDITDTSLVKRSIGTVPRAAVASPDYVARHGTPSRPADLADHNCLIHDIGAAPEVWRFATPQGTEEIRVSGGFRANDSASVLLAARAGYGIAYLTEVQVNDDLRSGALVRALGEFPDPGLPLSLVYPSRRHLAPRTRVVMDFIAAQIEQARDVVAAARHGVPLERHVTAPVTAMLHESRKAAKPAA